MVLGRGARYIGLAGIGVALPIPGPWLVLASLVALGFGVRGARKMNRSPDMVGSAPVAEKA